jgi:hypothetical protein
MTFFPGAPGTKILGTPAYPTQDELEPEPPKPHLRPAPFREGRKPALMPDRMGRTRPSGGSGSSSSSKPRLIVERYR